MVVVTVKGKIQSTMKTVLLSLFAVVLSLTLSAQTGRIGQHEGLTSNWNPSLRSNFSSVSEAKHYAQEIIDVVGLKPNFEVMAANVQNAAAVTYQGKRYVLYNPNFINQLVQKTGNKWAAISVLAHEIGHHLNGHTSTSTGSHPAIELESDEFSGFVLRKMGASLSDAQAAMKVLASNYASRTHPAKHDRLAYIEKGWKSADDQMAGRDVARVPDIKPQTQTTTTYPERNTTTVRNTGTRRTTSSGTNQSIISSRDIVGIVRFNKDPGTQYYITTGYNLIKVTNNSLSVIGKLTSLNSRNYPYMIYDNSTQLLVDIRGTIVTRNGQTVGRLTANRS